MQEGGPFCETPLPPSRVATEIPSIAKQQQIPLQNLEILFDAFQKHSQ
jgi:hypothetical protein